MKRQIKYSLLKQPSIPLDEGEKMQITKVKDKWRSKHKEKGGEKLTYQIILKYNSHHSNLLHAQYKQVL